MEPAPTARRHRGIVRRIRRLPVFVVAIGLALAGFLGQSVALPRAVLACSCAGPPPPLAEIVEEAGESVAIVAGTVGRPLPDRTPVAVSTWFHGTRPAEVVWLSGGTEMATSCDIVMSPGDERLFVLFAGEGGTYSANSCAPGGLIGTPDGDAALAAATATWGGRPPPTPEPEAAPAPGPSPWVGEGLLWVAAAVGVALLLFGVIAVAATRSARR